MVYHWFLLAMICWKQWGIYASIPSWTFSQNSLAAAEALTLKVVSATWTDVQLVLHTYYNSSMKKISLQSLIISAISIAFFEKGSYQQPTSFPQAMLCLWNLERENRGKSAFKLCDAWEIPNEPCFKNGHNNLGEIDDQIKEWNWL